VVPWLGTVYSDLEAYVLGQRAPSCQNSTGTAEHPAFAPRTGVSLPLSLVKFYGYVITNVVPIIIA
jgi:hypothetical protein